MCFSQPMRSLHGRQLLPLDARSRRIEAFADSLIRRSEFVTTFATQRYFRTNAHVFTYADSDGFWQLSSALFGRQFSCQIFCARSLTFFAVTNRLTAPQADVQNVFIQTTGICISFL